MKKNEINEEVIEIIDISSYIKYKYNNNNNNNLSTLPPSSSSSSSLSSYSSTLTSTSLSSYSLPSTTSSFSLSPSLSPSSSLDLPHHPHPPPPPHLTSNLEDNNLLEINKQLVINNVVHSLSTLGFVLITGHGINSNLLIEVSKQNELFYLQSLENKKLFYSSKDKARRGYSPIDTENFASLAGEKKPNDLVEKIRFGPELSSEEIENNSSYYHSNECKIHFMPNEWGNLPDTFRSTILEYYNAVQNLSIIILEILACGLNLPIDYFTSSMDHHTSILTLNHFPSLSSIPSIQPQQLRVAEHTDVSLITIVNQIQPLNYNINSSDNNHNLYHSQGLEICTPNGNWISVPNIPDSLVINIGDCLQYWSSNRLKSTRHRVSFPLKENYEDINQNDKEYDYELERYSIAFFVSPNYDTILHQPNDNLNEMKGEESISNNLTKGKDLTYSEWRKQRIKQAMKSLKQK